MIFITLKGKSLLQMIKKKQSLEETVCQIYGNVVSVLFFTYEPSQLSSALSRISMKYSFVGKVQTLLLALVSKLMKKNENFSVLLWPSFHQQYPTIFICWLELLTTKAYYNQTIWAQWGVGEQRDKLSWNFEFSFDYCSTVKANE